MLTQWSFWAVTRIPPELTLLSPGRIILSGSVLLLLVAWSEISQGNIGKAAGKRKLKFRLGAVRKGKYGTAGLGREGRRKSEWESP